MEDIIRICKHVIECMVDSDYKLLENEGALTRVSEKDIKRVLNDYNSSENIIMPPDDYYQHIYINEYKDGSGYHVDLDLWYRDGQSDLTLQLDIRKKGYGKLIFIIDDLRVL